MKQWLMIGCCCVLAQAASAAQDIKLLSNSSIAVLDHETKQTLHFTQGAHYLVSDALAEQLLRMHCKNTYGNNGMRFVVSQSADDLATSAQIALDEASNPDAWKDTRALYVEQLQHGELP